MSEDKRSRRGFSLLELMVVILVTAVLLGVAVQSYVSHLERAREVRCQEDLRVITDAARRCQADENEPVRLVAELKGKYLVNPEALTDPWGHPYQIDPEGPYSFGPDYIELPAHVLESFHRRCVALAAVIPGAIGAEPKLAGRTDRRIDLATLAHYPNQSELLDPWGRYLLFDHELDVVYSRGPRGGIIRLGDKARVEAGIEGRPKGTR